jgi:hypothetical protein
MTHDHRIPWNCTAAGHDYLKHEIARTEGIPMQQVISNALFAKYPHLEELEREDPTTWTGPTDVAELLSEIQILEAEADASTED